MFAKYGLLVAWDNVERLAFPIGALQLESEWKNQLITIPKFLVCKQTVDFVGFHYTPPFVRILIDVTSTYGQRSLQTSLGYRVKLSHVVANLQARIRSHISESTPSPHLRPEDWNKELGQLGFNYDARKTIVQSAYVNLRVLKAGTINNNWTFVVESAISYVNDRFEFLFRIDRRIQVLKGSMRNDYPETDKKELSRIVGRLISEGQMFSSSQDLGLES